MKKRIYELIMGLLVYFGFCQELKLTMSGHEYKIYTEGYP